MENIKIILHFKIKLSIPANYFINIRKIIFKIVIIKKTLSYDCSVTLRYVKTVKTNSYLRFTNLNIFMTYLQDLLYLNF